MRNWNNALAIDMVRYADGLLSAYEELKLLCLYQKFLLLLKCLLSAYEELKLNTFLFKLLQLAGLLSAYEELKLVL